MTLTERLGLGGLRYRVGRMAVALLLGMPLLAQPADSPSATPAPAQVTTDSQAEHAQGESQPVAAGQAGAGIALERADLEAWLDGFVPASLERADVAGLVISVVKDGQVLLKKGYGYADVAARRPMDPDRTLMRPGSTSKLFTWTAVMQLVERGQLDLDRDINGYLDFKIDYPFGKPVTLRQLMAHRGGFEEGLKSVLATDPKRLISNEQYLKANPRPMVFPPGEVPAYSNYGTSLAGYIVQRVSGEPFEAYVERHILAPLGMTRSTFVQPLPEKFVADMSKGYRSASEPPLPFELITTVPAGALSATAADMAKFMLAYLQDGQLGEQRILQAATVQEMQRGSARPYPGFATMSYGFFDEDRNGHHVVGHGGDTIVFHSDLFLLPKEGVGIFYSVNSRGAQDGAYPMRAALIKGFMDRYFPAETQPATASVTPVLSSAAFDAQQIAGRYESSRRVETAFVSLFYLLGQTVITANEDHTISMPGGPSGSPQTYRETAPNVWTQVDGEQKLALATIAGRRTVISSEDPTSVLQAVPAYRSGGWNEPLLIGSLAVLLLTVILWPVGALIRRHYRKPLQLSGQDAMARTLPRLAALFGLGWLFAWYSILAPLLSTQLDAFDTSLDPRLRLVQISGLILIAAAAVAVWGAWRTLRRASGVWTKVGSVLIAVALLYMVWFAGLSKLLSFNSSY